MMDTPDSSGSGSIFLTSTDGADCCDSPHPTKTKAAIVVISKCFITDSSNLLIINDLIFWCFLGHTFGQLFRLLHQKPLKHKESGDFSVLPQRF
jgi:hypothetical protein